jgi:hypothetical protein
VMQKGSEHKCTPAADVDLRMRLYR